MNYKLKLLSSWLNEHGFSKEANNPIFKKSSSCKPPFDESILLDIRNNNAILEIGARGPMVGALQELLENNNHTLNRYGIDCIFGSETKGALKSFQRKFNLSESGILDSNSLSYLSLSLLFSALTSDSIGAVDQHISDDDFPRWSNLGEFRRRSSNFHKIDDGKNNYRSAIPKQSIDFFKYLNQKYKIKNIVNLKSDKGEGNLVRQAGLNYLSIPLGSSPPSEPEWQQIKALLASGDTLVHCQHGADRTGAVIARWKIEEGASTPERAYQEALSYGFKPEDHPGWTGNPGDADPNRKLRKAIYASRPAQRVDS